MVKEDKDKVKETTNRSVLRAIHRDKARRSLQNQSVLNVGDLTPGFVWKAREHVISVERWVILHGIALLRYKNQRKSQLEFLRLLRQRQKIIPQWYQVIFLFQVFLHMH